jgi:two-component sensor histidine kinase
MQPRLRDEGDAVGAGLAKWRDALDLEIVRPDGTTRHTAARGEADLDAAGNVMGLHGSVQDITERKQAEHQIMRSLEEKEVLLSEVHHRVKNNMSIIASLLSLQSAYVDNKKYKDMFVECQSRIRSMALVHERLYINADFARIDMPGYIDGLVSNIRYTFAVPSTVIVNMAVEDVDLGIDTLIPCGLIINELMINAFKHAFDGHDSPEIGVALKRIEGGYAALTVSDNGKGLPEGFDVSASTGLGIKIVRTLCKQIQGSLEVRNGRGAMFTLTFPEQPRFAARDSSG